MSGSDAEDIRTARKQRRLSVRALSEATGVSESTIKRFESGFTDRATTLHVVQQYLRVGPYAPDPNARTPEAMTNAELTNRYWQLVNELGQVGAVMAQRLPQDERPPREPRPDLSEFVGPGEDAWRGDTASETG